MKVARSMALISVLPVGSIGFAQDVAIHVAKGAKDIGKGVEAVGKTPLAARKMSPETPLMPPTKQLKLRPGARRR